MVAALFQSEEETKVNVWRLVLFFLLFCKQKMSTWTVEIKDSSQIEKGRGHA